MHARVTRLTVDPSRIDETVAQLEERDLPAFKEQDGFKGLTLLVDRSSGDVTGTSYWESEEKMQAAAQVSQDARQRAAETGGAGAEPTVDHFEVALDTFEG